MGRYDAITQSIKNTRDDLITAVNNKGQSAPENTKISEIAPFIEAIESGGGRILTVTVDSDNFNGTECKATKDNQEIKGLFENRQCILTIPEDGTWKVTSPISIDNKEVTFISTNDINLQYIPHGSVNVTGTAYYGGTNGGYDVTLYLKDSKNVEHKKVYDNLGKTYTQYSFNYTFTEIPVGNASVWVTIRGKSSNSPKTVTVKQGETVIVDCGNNAIYSGDPGNPEEPWYSLGEDGPSTLEQKDPFRVELGGNNEQDN